VIIIQGKNIKVHIKNKISDWANSVTDNNTVKTAILENVIVTGGAIVSLLQDEKPHDYDVYFRNETSLKLVVDYYINKFVEKAGESINVKPVLQRCYWNEVKNAWTVLSGEESHDDVRLRVFIKSAGAVGADFEPHSETDMDYKKAIAKINEQVKKNKSESKEKSEHYFPTFMTNNAITLTDDIQVVLRFYGEPEEIHKNYDFVHCNSYWSSWNNNLVMPARALEAIINKELYYVGSKYPLCSIIRTRKYINRGWCINAGQYVKMILQLNELDLKNLHVFEEQLIGVDSAYFNDLIGRIEKMQKTDPDFKMESSYLIKLINNVFDEGIEKENE